MDKDRKLSKPVSLTAQESEEPSSSTDRRFGADLSEPELHPELEELHHRLQSEMRRPKPDEDAMAAALEVVQRFAAEVDAEDAADDMAEETLGTSSARLCRVCGYRNREGHRFCGMCGLPVDSDQSNTEPSRARGRGGSLPLTVTPPSYEEREPHPGSAASRGPAVAETHHYHHHYHHHYFPAGQESTSPRAVTDAGREADKLRASAIARGESMSRAEAAVRRVTQEWVLACNTKHLDDLLDLYVADGLVLRSNCPQIRGAAALREFFFGALDSGLGEVEVEPIRVEVVGDMAYEAGRCKALVPGAAGKRREERGKYVWVLARQGNGEWKIAVDCWSSDLTLAALESDLAPATGTKAVPTRKTV